MNRRLADMSKSNVMLAVDTSEPALLEHKKEFASVGIDIFRIDTIQEAISRFKARQEYLCAVINEDTIPNFMGLLPVLCDIAKTHIFVISSTYSKEKRTEAMRLGADAYVEFGETARIDVLCALEYLKKPAKWSVRNQEEISVVIGGNIVLLPEWHRVFFNNIEIPLTEKEFRLLHYLLANPNRTLEYDQMAEWVWGYEEDVSFNAVHQMVKRIRKKFSSVGVNSDFILNASGVGYRFSAVLV
jgi:DNA-binding response OmpR family regulator